jgi:hypothetical protein
MNIFENVLDEDYFKLVQKHYLSSHVTWYFNQNLAYGDNDERSNENNIFQFTTGVIRDGIVKTDDPKHVEIVHAIINKVFSNKNTTVEIVRAKFNLLPKQPYNEKELANTIHIDDPNIDTLSLLFYMNDSDGDTVILDGEKEHRYTPKANTAILFKSHLKHRSTPPTKVQKRVILNTVVKVL